MIWLNLIQEAGSITTGDVIEANQSILQMQSIKKRFVLVKIASCQVSLYGSPL